jgi:hypothetical protein
MSGHVITAPNPDDGLHDALWYLKECGLITNSRNGRVVRAPGPVLIQYERPDRRVLFSPLRDANPFFHFFEGLWMLNGSNDVESVSRFAKQMSAFSDDGKTLHGAYGYRWRRAFGIDQLADVVQKLNVDPGDRRCVVQMWDAGLDFNRPNAKDVPCNTQIYFDATKGVLDMTVTNRSNDVVWGCFGANVVHMSMLHEFVALSTDLPLGTYYQFTNNLHMYIDRPDCQRLMSTDGPDSRQWAVKFRAESKYDRLATYPMMALGDDPMEWLMANEAVVERSSAKGHRPAFFNAVAVPILMAHAAYKNDAPEIALKYISECKAEDWRAACTEWLHRRVDAKAAAV